MSKIYEALLRAERDRAETAPEPHAGEAATAVLPAGEQASPGWQADPPMGSILPRPAYIPAAAAPPTPASPGLSEFTSRFSPPDLPRTSSAPAAVGGPSNTASPAFDPSQVRPRLWTPLFAQLPALEERGSGVEQFRSLRSRMFEFRDLNKLKSILVSSGLPQEGKSFITANLAVSFSKHKASRVLLIDGDMRRSSLHKMLGAPNDIGLSDYLGGKATLPEILQRADTKDQPLPPGLASLTFISGGTEAEKAADLSGNRRFDQLIATLSPHFDWIVVDSSPVNLVADGVNLARACDGVLLIARGGTTKYETAQRALLELKASRILGFVLNAVKRPPVTGGYYGYDSYDSYDPPKREPELSAK